MPADDVEIVEGEEEGMRLHNAAGAASRLVGQDGKVRGIPRA